MNVSAIRLDRRDLLQATAGLAIAGGLGMNQPPSRQDPVRAAPGQPGEFGFLAGEWKISHRRRKASGQEDWDEFDGEATCWTILGGIGSVEELRIPARDFSGMGLRLLDVETRIWHDYWVNAKSGVMPAAGQTGSFTDGVAIFEADDVDGDRPIKVRGVWDQITSDSCRWRQSVSRDGGVTWEDNWVMLWKRAEVG